MPRKQQIKGDAERIKGKVGVTAGRTTGNRNQIIEGQVEQAKGTTRKNIAEKTQADTMRNTPIDGFFSRRTPSKKFLFRAR
ncbi:MAG: CsbD family protein [Nitrososphaerales archaeon]